MPVVGVEGGGSSAGNNPEASPSEEITVGEPLDFLRQTFHQISFSQSV